MRWGFATENNAFSISDVGYLFDIYCADMTISRTRVEAFEIGVIGEEGPDGGGVVVEGMDTAVCGK
jgi:hypothetical protein